MVIRIKGATIDAIEATETKRLKNVKISSKEAGISLTLDLPDALSGGFSVKETVEVIIDSNEIAKGEKARLYAEGSIFRIKTGEPFQVIGTIGGLRVEIKIDAATPAKKRTFESDGFYLAII